MSAEALVAWLVAGALLLGTAALIAWYVRFTAYRHDWRCGACAELFRIAPGAALLLPSHPPRSPRVTCPRCGARTVATAVPRG